MLITRRKLAYYEPNIAGYEVKVTVTCKAYESGGFVERIGFYHVDFNEKPTYEELLQQATECLENFKKEWLLTKDDLENDLRDYFYVLNSTIYTGFAKQSVAWKEETINDYK